LKTNTATWPKHVEWIAASLPTSLPILQILNLDASIEGDLNNKSVCATVDASLTALACLREINVVICDRYAKPWDNTTLMNYRETLYTVLPAVHRAGLLTVSQLEATDDVWFGS
jgi:hypothetical protein